MIIYDIAAIDTIAEKIISAVKHKRVWCFYGEMGAGKTTLIKQICEKLGVTSDMTSPSFGIINEYKTNKNDTIFHFDFYRIKNESEALDLGIYEYLDSGKYCFLEWPENIDSLLDDDYLKIYIKLVDETKRQITLIVNDREIQI
jgi:tRNA threonylcarbamoyladenosine biosynthesis protein TsaE